MREFIDVTGKTEEEALGKALAQLGLDRDDVSVEILERAKSGFLGLGSSPAKVRIYYGEEQEEPAPAAQAAPERAEKKPEARPERKSEAPRAERRPAEPRSEKKPERRGEARPDRERRPRPERKNDRRPERRPVSEPRPAPLPVQDLGEEVDDEKAQAIKTFLAGLMEQMELQAEAHVYQPEKGRYKVILEGANLGALIGRRGETLDAVQQLTSYAVNHGGGGRVRVQLDAENYRQKREQSLQHLARKVAGKVTKYHRSVTLEPMNAYERHVIHTALQEVAFVTTYSTGVEPNRRVIVAYDSEKRV